LLRCHARRRDADARRQRYDMMMLPLRAVAMLAAMPRR